MNRKVEVNSSFSFFYFVIDVREFSKAVKMLVHEFLTNFGLININNVMMFFLVCNQFAITRIYIKFHGVGDQCLVFVTIPIKPGFRYLCHETVESCIRDILDDSVDMCTDKTMIQISFNNNIERPIFLPK